MSIFVLYWLGVLIAWAALAEEESRTDNMPSWAYLFVCLSWFLAAFYVFAILSNITVALKEIAESLKK
jgi:hypothetical protein